MNCDALCRHFNLVAVFGGYDALCLIGVVTSSFGKWSNVLCLIKNNHYWCVRIRDQTHYFA
jgi:hypothetical protein